MYQIYRDTVPVCTVPNFDCVDEFLWVKEYPKDYFYLDLGAVNQYENCEIKHWREPDSKFEHDILDNQYIWYGPGGRDGDCATEVIANRDGFIVREYQCLKGYIDDIESLGANIFSVQETWVNYGTTNDPRLAAAIGVARIAQFGGKEYNVDGLPE